MAKNIRKILCVRTDNMGDILMSYPAIRQLKTHFGATITLLASNAGAPIVPFLPDIDEVIAAPIPWNKEKENTEARATVTDHLIQTIKEGNFDMAVIFTVYSQSALPASMLLLQAEVPRRVAYCRENPYGLLTDWLPDREPYNAILHQIQRDIRLVSFVTKTEIPEPDGLYLACPEQATDEWRALLHHMKIPWDRTIVIHPGVSEDKRKYPTAYWQALLRHIATWEDFHCIFTGTLSEKDYIESLLHNIKPAANFHNMAGLLSLDLWISALYHTRALLSVNTAATHIAAAVHTPMVVLYAQTNPQHLPWKANATIFTFPVHERQQSRNEIVRYVAQKIYRAKTSYPSVEKILAALKNCLEIPKSSAAQNKE